jgi:hypothetical protein
MMRYPLPLTLALLGACATPTAQNPTRGPLALVGTWNTARQYEAAAPAIKRPATAGDSTPWLDRQHARFVQISAPGLAKDGDIALFFAWRTGSPTGPISRERIWVFERDASGKIARMNFHTLKAPAPNIAFTDPRRAFAAFTRDDVISYPDLCKLPFEATASGWRAAIPVDCAITARSGRRMTLSAQIIFDGESLSYEEAGILDSGAFAFKVPSAEPYRFERTPQSVAAPDSRLYR